MLMSIERGEIADERGTAERVSRSSYRAPAVSSRHPAKAHLDRLQPGVVYGQAAHSHSMVAGGFDVTSYTTRFTPGTSFTSRLAMCPSTS